VKSSASLPTQAATNAERIDAVRVFLSRGG
jgi:hypothetical protein